MFHQRVCVCLCACVCVLTGRWHHILCHFMTFLDDFLSCWPSAAIVIANKQHQHTTYTVMSCIALNPTLCVCLNSWTWITTSSHHLNSCSLGQSLWKNKNESPNNEDEIYIIFSFFFVDFFPLCLVICCCLLLLLPVFFWLPCWRFSWMRCDPRKSPEGHTATFGAKQAHHTLLAAATLLAN